MYTTPSPTPIVATMKAARRAFSRRCQAEASGWTEDDRRGGPDPVGPIRSARRDADRDRDHRIVRLPSNGLPMPAASTPARRRDGATDHPDPRAPTRAFQHELATARRQRRYRLASSEPDGGNQRREDGRTEAHGGAHRERAALDHGVGHRDGHPEVDRRRARDRGETVAADDHARRSERSAEPAQRRLLQQLHEHDETRA
jgi:hypothetical protein